MKSDEKNFILSAFSDEYAASFEAQLQGIKSLQIQNIELRFINGKNLADLDEKEIKMVKERLEAYDIKASAIGSPLGKIKLDEDFKTHLEKAKKVFEAANLLETNLVRVFSFYAPEGQNVVEMKNEVTEKLGELIDLAGKEGITLCHENEANIYGDTPERCKELLNLFGGKLKCVFDMGNFVLEGVDPLKAYAELKEYIEYFHIKDALFEGAIVPAGRGDAKIKEIITKHKGFAKKDFFVSLEPHLQTFSGLNALVGRNFENPYKYEDEKTAFCDALTKFKELML